MALKSRTALSDTGKVGAAISAQKLKYHLCADERRGRQRHVHISENPNFGGSLKADSATSEVASDSCSETASARGIIAADPGDTAVRKISAVPSDEVSAKKEAPHRSVDNVRGKQVSAARSGQVRASPSCMEIIRARQVSTPTPDGEPPSTRRCKRPKKLQAFDIALPDTLEASGRGGERKARNASPDNPPPINVGGGVAHFVHFNEQW